MIGAIAGDIIGSVYESRSIKNKDFPLFSTYSTYTDDTVMTIAVADAILHQEPVKNKFIQQINNKEKYITSLRLYGKRYPYKGYGQNFKKWLISKNPRPYGSYGNGSAMRVSSVGFAFSDLKKVLSEAKLSAEITHNHKEGIKGAQAAACCVFLAKNGESKEYIKKFIIKKFNYNLNRKLSDIRKNYDFEISCQKSVPEAIISFLESENFEDTVRNAVSLGGDSDTIACIAGGIAQAFYKKISVNILSKVNFILDGTLKLKIEEFNKKYDIKY